MQKQLGHDAELSAAEVVRRAERCIGLAIRKGQEAGTIRKPRENGSRMPLGSRATQEKASPEGFFKNHVERSEAYAMTDGVSGEQFESAISEARKDRNLSRANVVRHAKRDGAMRGSVQLCGIKS